MNSFHEKLFFGFITMISSGFFLLGAIFTTGEARWIYVTLAASSMTSGFLALMFKRQEETIRLVVGRCGFAILGGILATQPIVKHFGYQQAVDDSVIALAGMSAATCIGTFFLGYVFLSTLERSAPKLVEKWFKKII